MQNYGYQNYGYQPSYSTPNYMQRAYAPQMPQMAQPQMQPQTSMQMQPPVEMPIQDIKFVNKAQAEAYIVFPNTKVMLIDKESGVVYVKTADGMGQTQTDYFRFEPINADGSPIKPQDNVPQVDYDEFVKKTDLSALGLVTIEQYNSLEEKIEHLQKQLEGGRQNGKTSKQAN